MTRMHQKENEGRQEPKTESRTFPIPPADLKRLILPTLLTIMLLPLLSRARSSDEEQLRVAVVCMKPGGVRTRREWGRCKYSGVWRATHLGHRLKARAGYLALTSLNDGLAQCAAPGPNRQGCGRVTAAPTRARLTCHNPSV
jgi:hypothetical protein